MIDRQCVTLTDLKYFDNIEKFGTHNEIKLLIFSYPVRVIYCNRGPAAIVKLPLGTVELFGKFYFVSSRFADLFQFHDP